MRFAIVVLVILLGVTAVGSAPSTRKSSTTHLMKKLLVQLLTRGGDSSDESEGSGLGYGVSIYYLIFTARNSSCKRYCFDRHLSVILFTGGWVSLVPGPFWVWVGMAGVGMSRRVWLLSPRTWGLRVGMFRVGVGAHPLQT